MSVIIVDGYIQLPPDSTGKIIDHSELIVNSNTVERQRVISADSTDACGLAAVTKYHAGSSTYGLVVRDPYTDDMATILQQLLDEFKTFQTIILSLLGGGNK